VRARFRHHTAHLLEGSGPLLIALSGGLDSVALLHLLRFGGSRRVLYAAHFDHRMRTGSAGDAAWVRGLCRAWDVPLIAAAAEVVPRSEADARRQRYSFLEAALTECGADLLLTAHHADDQAETVLFRLARGTGLAGLAGIPARRGRIVRPLLPFTRADLMAYATASGLRWREDPTNLDVRYARNRIRHVVLPALEAVSAGATARIAQLARRAADAESGWAAVVEGALPHVIAGRSATAVELARDQLLGYDPHVRARVLRHLLRDFGVVPDRTATAALMAFVRDGASGGAVQVGGGVRMIREFDRIRIERPPEPGTDSEQGVRIDAPVTGEAVLMLGGAQRRVDWGVAAREHADGAAGTNAGAETAQFDPAALRFPLHIRGWQPGDRMRLPGGRRKLKKLFQQHRVGRAARARVPVLVDAAGIVLWVAGVARSTDAQPSGAQRVFTITVMDGSPF
jgi:tRNA(Ile)-lysidine synthase